MTSKDIDRLVRWSVDSDLEKFAEEAYVNHIEEQLNKEVDSWMKSLLS